MLDYLSLEADLEGEERMVLETVREYAQEELRPDIADHWLDETFPESAITDMGELGLYGANLEGEGLPDMSDLANGLIMQELEAVDSGLRSMASVQSSLVLYPLVEYGSDVQRSGWVPDLASGEAVGCFALTEPEHGSDPGAMEATATLEDGQYVLNGTKTWITNAPIADVAIVWAREESAADAPVRGFLVETDRSGVEISKLEDKLSLRASITGQLELRDVAVPRENVLPGTVGMRGPLSCLTKARLGIVWGAVGATRDCMAVATDYAQDREQFGDPIGRFQLQQRKLAEMATQLTTAQLLAYRLTELDARGDLRPAQVAMGKRHNVRVARDQARVAREILGGNGITADYSPMRHLANMETVSTYEGTHDIQTLILGEDLTGFAAFRNDG